MSNKPHFMSEEDYVKQQKLFDMVAILQQKYKYSPLFNPKITMDIEALIETYKKEIKKMEKLVRLHSILEGKQPIDYMTKIPPGAIIIILFKSISHSALFFGISILGHS